MSGIVKHVNESEISFVIGQALIRKIGIPFEMRLSDQKQWSLSEVWLRTSLDFVLEDLDVH